MHYLTEVPVFFAKVHPNAKIPSKIEENACEDIYACFDEPYMMIPPNSTRLIPTGIASAFPPGYVFVLQERGSTGSKHIERRCGVIDSGFRDQWFVCLDNGSPKPLLIAKDVFIKMQASERESPQVSAQYTELNGVEHNYKAPIKHCLIYPYEKAIAQALFTEVPDKIIKEVSYDELLEMKSERGLGQLGSSGK